MHLILAGFPGRVWVKLPIHDPYPIYPNSFDIPDPNLIRNTQKNRVTRPEPDPKYPKKSGYLIHTRYQKMQNLKKKYFFLIESNKSNKLRLFLVDFEFFLNFIQYPRISSSPIKYPYILLNTYKKIY